MLRFNIAKACSQLRPFTISLTPYFAGSKDGYILGILETRAEIRSTGLAPVGFVCDNLHVQIGSLAAVIEEIGPQNGISDQIACPRACHTPGLAIGNTISDGLTEIVNQLKDAVDFVRSNPIASRFRHICP
jgi:hypothetical protein